MPQSRILYIAGIWQLTTKEKQFTILTTSPNASVSPVHDRMPLVLIPDEVSLGFRILRLQKSFLQKLLRF